MQLSNKRTKMKFTFPFDGTEGRISAGHVKYCMMMAYKNIHYSAWNTWCVWCYKHEAGVNVRENYHVQAM
jgi:hypothetical protein